MEQEKNEFIKLRDVNQENIEAFCGGYTYETTVVKSINKNTGNVSYTFSVKLNNKLSVTSRIKEQDYELICAERGKDTDIAQKHIFKSPCRIVRGKRTDGSYYYMVDCFLAQDYRQSFFLDDNQVKLIELLKGMGLRIVDKPETTVEELKEVLYPTNPLID